MKYTQVVFDVDGTLIDSEYAVLHSLQDTLRSLLGKTVALEELTFALGIPGLDALRRLGIDDAPAALALWEEHFPAYNSTVHVFEGIPELVKQLTAAGCQLGIVTSKTRGEFEQDFVRFGIQDQFQTILCADDTQRHKPDPEPLLKYMERTKCSRDELLYIGDSEYDLACATQAGVDFALAGWGASKKLCTPLVLTSPLSAMEIICGQ